MTDTKKKRGPKGPNSTSFKPGQSGNSGGAPKLSAELKAIKELHGNEFKRICSKYFRMNGPEFEMHIDNPYLPRIEQLVVNVINRSIVESDITIARELLERTMGKVKETVEIESASKDELIDEQLAGVPTQNVVDYLRRVAKVA